jgi:IS4 transposase
MPTWEEAFKHTDFGDKRRVERAIKLANKIDSKCEKSGASSLLSGHGELKAVSRFLNSSGANHENITEGFMNFNCKNIATSHVLLVEDTSELNFAWRKKEIDGLGPTGNGKDQGFFIHPAVIINPAESTLLGIAGLGIMTREHGQHTTAGDKYKRKDITKKESYRWLEVPRQGINRIPSHIKKTVVADREADIYDIFSAHQKGELGDNCELLIRASRNRKITGKKHFLYEEIDSWEAQGIHEVTISGDSKRKKRNAICSVRFGSVGFEIPRSQKYRKGKESIDSVYIIDIRENNPDENGDCLHWRLLTTWPVTKLEEAIEKIEWYRNRWLIEELFRVLKSGYKVESVRFDSGKALINWCALRLLMAVKIMYIRTHRDDESPGSANTIFSDIELKVLEACESQLISPNSTIHRPEKFSTAWASLLVAIMGGYHALPSAKPFGQTTLWRGLVSLEGAVIGYQAAMNKSG